MKTYWIVIRSPGYVISVLAGSQEEVTVEINRLNEHDLDGSMHVLSGPFEAEEVAIEFDRLNACNTAAFPKGRWA